MQEAGALHKSRVPILFFIFSNLRTFPLSLVVGYLLLVGRQQAAICWLGGRARIGKAGGGGATPPLFFIEQLAASTTAVVCIIKGGLFTVCSENRPGFVF